MPELEWYGASTPDENSISRLTGVTGYGFFWILASSSVVLVTLLHAYLGLLSFEAFSIVKFSDMFAKWRIKKKPMTDERVPNRVPATASAVTNSLHGGDDAKAV